MYSILCNNIDFHSCFYFHFVVLARCQNTFMAGSERSMVPDCNTDMLKLPMYTLSGFIFCCMELKKAILNLGQNRICYQGFRVMYICVERWPY